MASTEPRAGFRPPWALNVDSDESTDATPVTGDPEALDASGDLEPASAEAEAHEAEAVEAEAHEAETAPPSAAPAPTKFQVDLARAMRAAAETARTESMERLAAESQARIEAIRARSADAATELRQRADDDIAEIRDWSKAELARVRAEADAKITDRKSWLEREIEGHEESIEVLVSAVTSRVTAFETELEEFFGRLAEEEDPTRIAVLAQTLPDVPSLDDEAVIEAASTSAETADVSAEAADTVEAETTPMTADPDAPMAEETGTVSEATAEATPAQLDPWADAPGWGVPLVNEQAPDQDGTADAYAGESADIDSSAVDRRLAAFGLDSGSDDTTTTEAGASTEVVAGETDAEAVASAEAEFVDAEAAAEPESGSTEVVADATAAETETGADATVAESEPVAESAAGPTETNVIVDGLISVASIAGFKRNLSRVDGVHAVTVSSGPDGEFIFAVRHDESASLEDAMPTMPGFGARVTGTQAGQINVTAHDAETASDDAMLGAAGPRS